MDDGEAFEADPEPAKVVQPGDGALDDPAGLAEATTVGLPTAGDFGMDSGGVQGLAVLVVVVAAITLNDYRLLQRASALAANGRNGLNQRNELGDIVPIGAGQDERERDPLRFGDEVVLGARASTVGGIWSCF